MAVDLRDTDVQVHVVNPGVLDTELFHFPTTSPASTTRSRCSPSTRSSEPVLAQLDAGTFEAYVPDWFGDVVSGKFRDPNAFITGTKDYARSQTS